MQILFFMSLLVVLFSLEEEESEADLSIKLQACWLVSVKEIAKNPEEINKIMQFTASKNLTDKQHIHDKIQMDMIGRCFGFIDVLDANKILNDLNGTEFEGPYMREVISDFTYDHYLSPDQSYEFDDLDNNLMRIIKKLEKDLKDYQQEQEAKKNKNSNVQITKQESREEWMEQKKNAERKNAETMQATETKEEIQSVTETQPSDEQYILFASILGSLALVAFWIIRKMNKLDDQKVKKQKKL